MWWILATPAATFNVPGDAVDLNEALALAGADDEIVFAAGTYCGSGGLGPQHTNLTIRGQGNATVLDTSCTNQNSMVVATDAVGVVFEQLVFDGDDSERHVAMTGSSIDFHQVGFRNAWRNNGSGASLRLDGSEVVCSQCDFLDNTTLSGNGVVAAYGSSTLTITDSTFQGGSAVYGGAIWKDDTTTVTVERVTFDSNTATFSGGAIVCEGSGLCVVRESTFCNNDAAAGEGGAIKIFGDVRVETSVFAFNNGGFGGALQVSGTLEVVNNTFFANTSSYGRSLRGYGGTLTLVDNIFAGHSGSPLSYQFTTVTGTHNMWDQPPGDPLSNPVAGPPGFVDGIGSSCAELDLHLAAGSNAIGTASGTGVHPDLGAFEADIDADGDGEPGSTDCDDADPNVFTGAPESCNEMDDDCDGHVDEGVLVQFFSDDDDDGYGDPGVTVDACTAPTGFVDNDLDCDDDNTAVFPGAPEVCNEVDDDCDGTPDQGITPPTWYADGDDDGFGAPGSGLEACEAPPGHVVEGGDCDDASATVFPGAHEVCNELDDDCDGDVDEDLTPPSWWPDGDGDGFGSGAPVQACTAPAQTAGNDEDCDDTNPHVNPHALELCNGIDDDCEGGADDGLSFTNWYADTDVDGFGDPQASLSACAQPANHVHDATDCDDTASTIFPGATEVCNELDDDCDGDIDEDTTELGTWYLDADHDGFGDPASSVESCTNPGDHVLSGGDCDDSNPMVNPGGQEVCGPDDEDCDGLIDIDDDSLDLGSAQAWHNDFDADGFGSGAAFYACTQPSGTVQDGTDCDDADAAVHPDALEICDGRDNDCDALVDAHDPDAELTDWYQDLDGDGVGDLLLATSCEAPPDAVEVTGDCDDSDPLVYPGAHEPCDGQDYDCDGLPAGDLWFTDDDGDGYGDPASETRACDQPPGTVTDGTDCDDSDATVHPMATEIPGDGIDQDCDGEDLPAGPTADTGMDTGDGTERALRVTDAGCRCASASSPIPIGWLRR